MQIAKLMSVEQIQGRLSVDGAKGVVASRCNMAVYFKSELSVRFRLIYIASRLLIGKQFSGKVRWAAAAGNVYIDCHGGCKHRACTTTFTPRVGVDGIARRIVPRHEIRGFIDAAIHPGLTADRPPASTRGGRVVPIEVTTTCPNNEFVDDAG
ncbi:hypothetical protein LSAT2_020192 [Lamellibrachia satsuma]|nr:hypothetical protein LSAT2_020192 [Lamellibrachia satsuma]